MVYLILLELYLIYKYKAYKLLLVSLDIFPDIAASHKRNHQYRCQGKRCQKQKDSNSYKTALMPFHSRTYHNLVFQYFHLLSDLHQAGRTHTLCVLLSET